MQPWRSNIHLGYRLSAIREALPLCGKSDRLFFEEIRQVARSLLSTLLRSHRHATHNKSMNERRTQIPELQWLLARNRMTLATGAAILMLILYFVQWVIGYFHCGSIERWLGLSRSGLSYGCLWQPVTYLMLHHVGYPFGLCFTLLSLMVIGNELEGIIGRKHFAFLFLTSGIVAGLMYVSAMPRGLLLGTGPAVCGVIIGCTTTLSEFFVMPLFRIQLRYKHIGWVLILGLLAYALLSRSTGATLTALVNLTGASVGWAYVRILGFGRPLPGEMTLRQRLAERLRAKRLPLRQYLAAYVDPILEKIHREGVLSLSRTEKRILRQARQKMLVTLS
jgi:membrane associated rhomboid family serine protease